ncbi:MAG: hypothetical protein RLZZ505_2681 [Verrucomicrobiota bacterium]|jgi:hypothetical protein
METANQPHPESLEATMPVECPHDFVVHDLFDDPVLVDLIRAYDACMKNREVDIGFNLFNLISPVYYRENLHSDIIKEILDPNSAHGRGDSHLRLFIEYLNEHHGLAIDQNHYRTAEVLREPGRIDLLIRDDENKRVIIIENKISGAIDQYRQIPRYLDTVESEYQLKCDAILYLNLSQLKGPDTTDWSHQERGRIKPLLKVIRAYHESDADLYHGWLIKCIQDPHEEPDFVIFQYSNLIKKLARHIMNEPTMEKFYEWASSKETCEKIASFTKMVSDLPAYRISRIQKHSFSHPAPFSRTSIPKQTTLVVEGFARDPEHQSRIKIHVEAEPDQTTLSFWDNNGDGENIGRFPAQILEEIRMKNEFIENQGWYQRSFKFPEGEKNLADFIKEFLQALRHYCPPITDH